MMSVNEETKLSLAVVLRENGISGDCELLTLESERERDWGGV